MNKLSFPHPKESPYEISVQLAQWFQKRRCLKMLKDDGPRVTGILISSGELKRNVSDYKLLAINRNILTDFKNATLG